MYPQFETQGLLVIGKYMSIMGDLARYGSLGKKKREKVVGKRGAVKKTTIGTIDG